MQEITRLSSGVGTTYGLGVNATLVGGRRRISHGGAVSGFLTTNEVYPDERAAVVVFANTYPGAADPNGTIASRIRGIIFERSGSVAAAALTRMRAIYADLQRGRIDGSQ